MTLSCLGLAVGGFQAVADRAVETGADLRRLEEELAGGSLESRKHALHQLERLAANRSERQDKIDDILETVIAKGLRNQPLSLYDEVLELVVSLGPDHVTTVLPALVAVRADVEVDRIFSLDRAIDRLVRARPLEGVEALLRLLEDREVHDVEHRTLAANVLNASFRSLRYDSAIERIRKPMSVRYASLLEDSLGHLNPAEGEFRSALYVGLEQMDFDIRRAPKGRELAMRAFLEETANNNTERSYARNRRVVSAWIQRVRLSPIERLPIVALGLHHDDLSLIRKSVSELLANTAREGSALRVATREFVQKNVGAQSDILILWWALRQRESIDPTLSSVYRIGSLRDDLELLVNRLKIRPESFEVFLHRNPSARAHFVRMLWLDPQVVGAVLREHFEVYNLITAEEQVEVWKTLARDRNPDIQREAKERLAEIDDPSNAIR